MKLESSRSEFDNSFSIEKINLKRCYIRDSFFKQIILWTQDINDFMNDAQLYSVELFKLL